MLWKYNYLWYIIINVIFYNEVMVIKKLNKLFKVIMFLSDIWFKIDDVWVFI